VAHKDYKAYRYRWQAFEPNGYAVMAERLDPAAVAVLDGPDHPSK